jgi:N-hydroxyarylamine O-acetyltransferase
VTTFLTRDLVDRVLEKLELPSAPTQDLQGLRMVYGAWCRKVPFDNTRKLIHLRQSRSEPLPGDEPNDFLEAWLTHGTGGTCWAGNGALQALLVALGFNAVRGVGTMVIAPDAPPNHGTVLVACEDALYLTDASILHGEPLHLDPHGSTRVTHPAWGVECSKRYRHWLIRWRPMHRPEGLDCRIDRVDVMGSVFREHHERTREHSPFNHELYVRTVRGNRIVGIAHGTRIEFTGTAEPSRAPMTSADRTRFLIEELGLSEEIVSTLPADRPLPAATL